LINRAKEEGQMSGVILHIHDDHLSILQYADDTILFMDHNFDQARNMKLLLTTFEKLSSLKINFHKSEIFLFGQAKYYEFQYQQQFGCKKVSYPFKYLGIPMHYRKLNNVDWKMIEERIEKKLSYWKCKYLSLCRRLVFINAVHTSLPMFMLSFSEVPKEVLKKFDYLISYFSGRMIAKRRNID
jgi:hypothetical protein